MDLLDIPTTSISVMMVDGEKHELKPVTQREVRKMYGMDLIIRDDPMNLKTLDKKCLSFQPNVVDKKNFSSR